MKAFIVECNIAGEYQSISKKYVEANNSTEACEAALLDECKGTIGENAEFNEERTEIKDMDGEFTYSVRNCKEIPEEHAAVIRLYF